jgi:hypothetical protein
VIVGAVALFFCYSFNIAGLKTFLDGSFDQMDVKVKSSDMLVYDAWTTLLPFAELVLAVLCGWIVIRVLAGLFRGASKAAQLSGRETMTVSEFVALAERHKISPKVAREAYRLLRPYYRNQVEIRMSDDLKKTLRLNHHELDDLFANLLMNSDRRSGSDPDDIETVLELLRSVENVAPRSL